MNDHSLQNARTHNTVIGILTVASLGAISGSISLGWENWVTPLMIIGLIAAWILHFSQYGEERTRENYYLIFTMLVSFYHGIHRSSFFDIVVVSALMMVNVTLLRRKEFVALMLIEFFALMTEQILAGVRMGTLTLDTMTVARILLHVVAELCIYKGLSDVIRNNRKDAEELEILRQEKESVRNEMEDFLVNISHELRTPVNVINGMSAMLLNRENSKDVLSIREAGIRLSRQIEDIQDYSEIQRGDVHLEEERYQITSVINDIIADYRAAGAESGKDFVIDLDPDVPAILKGDAGKISKIIRHLLDNAYKFTAQGGFILKVRADRREYGINLIIEVTDTGIGMSRDEIDGIARGLYQGDKKRNRKTGGVGLGLSIVYGFVRRMNGFVNIESRRGKGTTVRVCIAQEIIDPAPCLHVDGERFLNVAVYLDPERFAVPEAAEFHRLMAAHLAAGLRINLYSAPNLSELGRLMEHEDITHVFTSEEDYLRSPDHFEELAKGGVTVAVSAWDGFQPAPGSPVITMPRPLCSCTVVRILSGENEPFILPEGEEERRIVLDGIRALVVDDEPMNLVVAEGLFRGYHMIIDTAESGPQALKKYAHNQYDVVFMDHMMPGMDGIEAAGRIREIAASRGRSARIVALTANAVSGAREMFMREGFDGFISKPIRISEFERTMGRLFPAGGSVPARSVS
ncbi:MAG: response regulator [Lachnospiraceae bacterium]|nr:response regulator [Lachnospiraceae bacterium]